MTGCTHKRGFIIGATLFASLALNLFLAGWLFGADAFREPPSSGRGMFFERFNEKAEALPKDERAAVQEVLDYYQPRLRKQMKTLMRTRDAIDTMYQRDDYSRAEAEERFATMQEQSIAMQQLMQSMMLDLADVLPPEKRAAFMERPKEWRGKGAEFRGKKKVESKP